MYLRTDTEGEFPEPDGDTIEEVIRGLLQNPDESSAILIESEERNSFMQTHPFDASTFWVEFHVGLGTEAQHYRLENVSIETVLVLFQMFNAGETSWKNDYPWIDVTGEMAHPTSDYCKQEIGRTEAEWFQLIWQSGPKDQNARKEWLKTEHGVNGRRAAMLALWASSGLEELVNSSKELEDSKNRLKESKSYLEARLEALIERSISAMRDGNQQGIEDCRKLVERFRSLLKTSDGADLQKWREPFDQIAEQLKGMGKASVNSLSEGAVYLLKAGPYYKIGNSINYERRLGQIKLQLPYAVEEVHQIQTDDPRGVESYWHKRFSKKRAHGEWFLLTDEDVVIFKSRIKM